MVSEDDPFYAFAKMWDYMMKKQNENKDLKKILHPIAWLKEYCTLKFGLCRQSGHSTIIKGFIHDKTAIFCFTHNIGKLLYGRNNYMTFNQIDQLRGKKKEFIFVDNYSFMSKKQEEKLYKTLSQDTKIVALIQ
jgi:hypothetical protein